MKTKFKFIGIIAVILVLVVISPFIAVPLIHNYKLVTMSEELDKALNTKELPPNMVIIGKHDAVEGPFTSNYCTSFAGALLKTKLSYKEFARFYSDTTSNTRIAWLNEASVTLNETTEGEQTYSYTCHTCFPRGVKKLFEEFKNSMQSYFDYAIVFRDDYYISDYDWRCN